MADIGTLSDDEATNVKAWTENGGILVRFAGPRLEKGGDELLPIPLRLGGRELGGALSWSTPQALAEFSEDSLFSGLEVPKEVLIRRQVLADPTRLGPGVDVWARLNDGTPLVTSAKLGEGRIVLFHVTANTKWSNLPLSGLFVNMLRRLATLGKLGGGTVDSSILTQDGSCKPRNQPIRLTSDPGSGWLRCAASATANRAGYSACDIRKDDTLRYQIPPGIMAPPVARAHSTSSPKRRS